MTDITKAMLDAGARVLSDGYRATIRQAADGQWAVTRPDDDRAVSAHPCRHDAQTAMILQEPRIMAEDVFRAMDAARVIRGQR